MNGYDNRIVNISADYIPALQEIAITHDEDTSELVLIAISSRIRANQRRVAAKLIETEKITATEHLSLRDTAHNAIILGSLALLEPTPSQPAYNERLTYSVDIPETPDRWSDIETAVLEDQALIGVSEPAVFPRALDEFANAAVHDYLMEQQFSHSTQPIATEMKHIGRLVELEHQATTQ